FFFFQAEDGIRDRNVTGVQTCALPIFLREILLWSKYNPCGSHHQEKQQDNGENGIFRFAFFPFFFYILYFHRKILLAVLQSGFRSEERRVGKECRSWYMEYDGTG